MISDYHDPRWQKFRLKRLQRANWKCDNCGDAGKKLNIHHSYYVSGRKPWDYPHLSTLVLCDECHQTEHEFTGDGRPDFNEDFPFQIWELHASLEILRNCEFRIKQAERRKQIELSHPGFFEELERKFGNVR